MYTATIQDWSTGKQWERAIFRGFGWTTVRGIGQLQILTRVSILALILVPILAGAWPAGRVAINRSNEAITEASERFDRSAATLTAAAEATTIQTIHDEIRQFGQWASNWRDRFGSMTLDNRALPVTMALGFFAAVFVTIGQIIDQTRAPDLIRKQDEDAFVEWMQRRSPEGPDRADG